jgi:hypothetical protein
MSDRVAMWVGAAAVAFSALYLASDAIEAAQGGFSAAQLWVTLVAEAAIPFVVVGLYAAQRPPIGALGLASALVYAYAYVFFTWTVVYALIHDVPDYDALSDAFGVWMTAHGALMVLGGVGFAHAVRRAGRLPGWTAGLLATGVVLVAATQGAPELVQLAAAGVRDLGFAGMGAVLLLGARQTVAPTPRA